MKVAHALGWFSIALGIGQLVAPRAVARMAGVDTRTGVVRLYGLRELACGVGILTSRNPASFLWARVGGDAIDLGTLATGSRRNEKNRRRALTAAANVACVAALDVYAANGLGKAASAASAAQAVADYSDRSGFPRAPAQMRGAALADFEMPRDMCTPTLLQSFTRKARRVMGERLRAGGTMLPS
ncbi:hypothetical protein CIC12_11920 [Burkholderia sp. SG-MS1]|nr:hypothetical protein [Paraburkholderia sp. SG-MS1]NKJ47436.1 hypothetical protein [Paraburkholderia sp. SG-MS1]